MRKFKVDNTTVQLEKGTMWVYDFGAIKLHAYETKDMFDTFVFIIEKNGQAVLLESPPVGDNWEELIDYIAGLGHKNIDLIVSYHPIGAKFIKTDKITFTNVYSMEHAVENYTTGMGAKSLPMLKKTVGELFDETVFKPTVMLEEGENEIAGIKFIMNHADFAFDVAIPEISIVHPHMLAHDRHALIFNFEHLDSLISQFKGYQEKGYEMFISSHGAPETPGDLTIKLRYLEDLKKIAKESSDGKAFIEKMNQTYPGYGWDFYLMGSAGLLFK